MDGIYETLQMKDITDEFDPKEIETQKLLGILTTIFPFLFFLPFISYKDSLLAKKISNHSFVLLVALIAVGIVSSIVSHIPLIGWLISKVLWLAYFVLVVIIIMDSANNKVRTLPFGIDIAIFK